MIEYELVGNRMDDIEGFPPALKALVQHMLIAHQGKYEFGSPKLPMFREALLLHYLDDLDSKMAAVRSALESGAGEGNWTAFSGALERRFLRSQRFLFRGTETSPKRGGPPTCPGRARRTKAKGQRPWT